MTQATEQDAWTETFLITAQSKAGNARNIRALITTYDVTGGDKDFSTIANAKGGRIKKFEIQTDYEVTLEGYATQAGDGEGFFGLIHTDDTSQAISITPDHTRTEHMLAIMHTTSTSLTSAVSATSIGDRAMRDVFKNGHYTSVNQSFTDGICKFTIKFKAAPFNKSASANVTLESSDGSGEVVLDAVTYT